MMETAYEPSARMIGAGLGLEIDRVTLDFFDAARARCDLQLRWGEVREGTVGGMRFELKAWVGDLPFVVFRTFWKVVDDLDPDWGYGSIKYRMALEGDPALELSFESARKHPDGDEGYWGRVWTAMNGVNAIPAVGGPAGLVRPRSESFGEPSDG